MGRGQFLQLNDQKSKVCYIMTMNNLFIMSFFDINFWVGVPASPSSSSLMSPSSFASDLR